MSPPTTGYITAKVSVVLSHTYVALAETGEDDYYIIFNVVSHDDDLNLVAIDYLYKYFK